VAAAGRAGSFNTGKNPTSSGRPKPKNFKREHHNQSIGNHQQLDSDILVDGWQEKRFEIRIAEELLKPDLPEQHGRKSEFPCRQVPFSVWPCPGVS
jgi:hypothetical protein